MPRSVIVFAIGLLGLLSEAKAAFDPLQATNLADFKDKDVCGVSINYYLDDKYIPYSEHNLDELVEDLQRTLKLNFYNNKYDYCSAKIEINIEGHRNNTGGILYYHRLYIKSFETYVTTETGKAQVSFPVIYSLDLYGMANENQYNKLIE